MQFRSRIYIYVRGKTFPLSWPHARNTQRSPLSTVSLQPRHDFFHENKAILRSFAVHPLPYLTFPLCPTSCTKIYSRQKKGAGKKKNCLDSFLDRRNAIFATENRRSAKKEEVGGEKKIINFRAISREREVRQHFHRANARLFLRSWKKRFRNCNCGATSEASTSSFPAETLPFKASSFSSDGKKKERKKYTNILREIGFVLDRSSLDRKAFSFPYEKFVR